MRRLLPDAAICVPAVLFLSSTLLLSGPAPRSHAAAPRLPEKPRLIILADMGNEPDEEQQMVHMLMYANEFELEGLLAVTGKFLSPSHKNPKKQKVRPDLFHKLIDGYAKVVGNLRQHAKGWPSPERLHSITAPGQPGYGIADAGQGKSSPGSRLLVRALERDDPRRLHVVVNAGSNTLAQALLDFQAKHSSEELAAALARLQVYENGAQDNAGAWICHRFPEIEWLRSNYQTYAYGGPSWEARPGDPESIGPNAWQPHPTDADGQHAWAKEHVQTGHGPLGALYPDRRFGKRLAFLEGGGTTPWIGLANRGLYDPDHPGWGGWGGRFGTTRQKDVWSRHASVKKDEADCAPFSVFVPAADTWTDPQTGDKRTSLYAPVWRWRQAMYNDLRCRMDWCVNPYGEANHNPIAAVAGDQTDRILRLKVEPGPHTLDASASNDPDGDALDFRWFLYAEAGTFTGDVPLERSSQAKAAVRVPEAARGKQIHVILQVRDRSEIAPMYDYRRIVLDVAGG